MAESFTDGLIVLHRGRIVTERYENGMTPATPHLLQSVSKSFAGVLAGIVAERGQLDVDGLVTDHVSDLAGSSFEGATVRDVLDMRTGTAYDETYTDRDADVCITEQLGAWRPARPGRTAVNLYEQIAQLENDGPHGVAFRYRSILTDLLGWILERSTGLRYADLLSRELWSKLGAEQDSEITIHRGVTMPSGGMSATLRDLARFGQMMLQGGQLGGRRIVPEAWALDSRTGDAASRAAFEQGELRKDMPGWLYRSKWWVQDAERGIHMALGIHGQTIWLAPSGRRGLRQALDLADRARRPGGGAHTERIRGDRRAVAAGGLSRQAGYAAWIMVGRPADHISTTRFRICSSTWSICSPSRAT